MRISIAAATVGILLFAGFGCRPILDARVKPAQDQPSMWLPEDPKVDFWHDPDLTGQITIDVRSQPGTTIMVRLDGPGILPPAQQFLDADKDGRAHFKWRTNRLGHYKYQGSITFNRSVVESFSDEFDNDIDVAR
ncbi:MAG: hypothetical protein RL272_420 [Candidatus Parcubacteria bacterium]|jgi:hypothetical protein